MNSWEPIKSETEPYGVLAQITKEAFALEGIDVEFRIAPWKRGYDYVKEGIWHGIVGWNRTDEREKIFHISTPVLLEDVVFFFRKDLSLQWTDIEDLEGLTSGAITGYNYGSLFNEALAKGFLEEEKTDSEEQSIKMLFRERFYIWPCEVDVGLHLIDTYLSPAEANQLTYSPTPIQVSDLCLLLSRQIPENQRYSELFEVGLEKLKQSGRYRDIIEELLPGSESLKYAQ